jgi:hypothetical protein
VKPLRHQPAAARQAWMRSAERFLAARGLPRGRLRIVARRAATSSTKSSAACAR